MLTLGIETATKVSSVALCEEGKPLASYEINMGMTHSEGLLPQIEQMLTRTKVAKQDLALVAVSQGPGSFTGLRIGLATAEALAYGLKKPLQAVSTLEVLAYNIPVPNLTLACLLDAQKGNYYVALYHWEDSTLVEDLPVAIKPGAEIIEYLGALPQQVMLLGECHKLKMPLPVNVKLVPEDLRLPRAVAVANLAAKKYRPEEQVDYFGLEPFYLRRSEAEELWEQKKNKE